MNEPFDAREEREIRENLRESDSPPCPRCGGRLHLTRVPIPGAVAYVRRRVLVRCPACRTRAAVDRRSTDR